MGLEQDLRRIIAQGERTLPSSTLRTAYKEALEPQYRLMLNLLVRTQPTTAACVDDYLRVVGAIREPETLAGLDEISADAPTLEQKLRSPIRILGSRLAHLQRTTVLVVESGADLLTLCAVRSGPEPLEARIALARAPAELLNSAIGLIAAHRGDIERIDRKELLDDELFEGLKAIGAATWNALPAAILSHIEHADTILYVPSAHGHLSELPIELWWDGSQWLGASRSIARFPSLGILMETLAPNRSPACLKPSAYIVRADDEDGLEQVQREVGDVTAALKSMGISTRSQTQPEIHQVRESLDQGFRVFHFVGHGMANPLGEALPIGKTGELRPADFSVLGGARTPFAFLNVCEVGRARVGAAGAPVGFATRLVEKGAPAVIACLQQVPDEVASDIAIAFYRAAAHEAVGMALSRARAAMAAAEYPPSCWGAYVLYGDPMFELAGADSRVRQMRDLTLGWSDHVARFLATKAPAERELALEKLGFERQAARPPWAALLERASAWVAAAFGPKGGESYDDRLALCAAFAEGDVAAACALRMLLAMECLEGRHARVDKFMEAKCGLVTGAALHDAVAWPAFASWVAGQTRSGAPSIEVTSLLDEAQGMLAAWALSEPAVLPLLNSVRKRLRQ